MSELRDHEWLLARARGEDVSHVPAATRAAYDHLERLIKQLPPTPSLPPGCRRRTLEALRAAPAPRRPMSRKRWLIGIGAVMTAGTVALLIAIRPPSPASPPPIEEPTVTSMIRPAPRPHRGSGANIDDTLVVKIEANQPVETRIYNDAGEMLARCHDQEECAIQHDGPRTRWKLEVLLRARGDVRIVLFLGASVPEPRGTLERDSAAAYDAGVEIRTQPPIPVE
jgi:hypothetical protein